MSTHIEINVLPIEVSWSWVSTSSGIINWKFKNPNNVPISFVLMRGVLPTSAKLIPENIYMFGDAFYPLYYYNFGMQFLIGQPTPLKSSNVQPPLAIFKTPINTLVAGFVFTLGANSSWNMNEAGFVGYEPAGISTIIVSYSQISKFSIEYDKQFSCEQYNKQAGTSFPCPPDPFIVDSALFLIPQTVISEVPLNIITEVSGNNGNSSGGDSAKCIDSLISDILGGNLKLVVEDLICIFGAIDSGSQTALRTKLESIRHNL